MCDSVAVMYAGRLVESGPVRRIFNAPAHPYTRALVESIPRLGDAPERLTAIDGQPPDLIRAARRLRLPSPLPAGDRSVPDRGAAETVEVEPDHRARCWVMAAGPRSRS